MVNKTLLGGVIGFLLGGLVVSTAAVTIEKDDNKDNPTTVSHNQGVNERLGQLNGDEFDKAFIEEMINHHQGAIDMAKLADKNAKHDEIKKLSQDIISAQSSEIDLMNSWQSSWGYKEKESHNSHR
jgi:uncharacterized protein (DUF305 family)